jgi:hypothetical protein
VKAVLSVQAKRLGSASLAHLAILTTLLSSGCNVFKPGFVREDSYQVEVRDDNAKVDGVDGPTGGHFDDEGNWVPDNPDIPMTYKIPDIGAGFIFDVNSLDVSPSLQVELLEIDTHIPYVRTLKLDAGVAYQRGYLYVGKLWTSIFEISTGVFAGWNWEDNQMSYGVGATIIRF